jgi:serine/threonine-protein kinase
LRNRCLDDAGKREQFVREGEMGRALRHPNIVPIYEVSADSRSCYLVMEFIEGGNLREFLRSGRKFEPLEATKLALDVCRGLDYAFQRGVSHRDLKASNVLISSLGQAKLVDFGLAGADPATSDDELEKIENPRTIDYAALERATGVRKDDARSDIFFLGCIVYHMLTGKAPMEETRDRIARLSRTRLESIVSIYDQAPDLPRDLASVIHKAMQFDPKLRYQTPGEMVADLQIVFERLSTGGEEGGRALGEGATKRRTIMIVEPNPQVQEMLRNHFKQEGYRVLVTTDPHRPASLFSDGKQSADCVIFSTSSLGKEALEAFNDFGGMPNTQAVPAILLLAAKHQDWAPSAKTSECHGIAATPIKMKKLMQMIENLLPVEKR